MRAKLTADHYKLLGLSRNCSQDEVPSWSLAWLASSATTMMPTAPTHFFPRPYYIWHLRAWAMQLARVGTCNSSIVQ